MDGTELTLIIRVTEAQAETIADLSALTVPEAEEKCEAILCAMDRGAYEKLSARKTEGTLPLDCDGMTPEEAANRALEEASGNAILFLAPGEQPGKTTAAKVRAGMERWTGETDVLAFPVTRKEKKGTVPERRGYRKEQIYPLDSYDAPAVPVSLTGLVFRAETVRERKIRFREDIGSRCAEACFIADLLSAKPAVGYLTGVSFTVPYDAAAEVLKQEQAKNEPAEWFRAAVTERLQADRGIFTQRYALTVAEPQLHCYATWTELMPEPDYTAEIREEIGRALTYIDEDTIRNMGGLLSNLQRGFLLKEKTGAAEKREEDSAENTSGDKRMILEYVRYLDGKIYLTCVRTLKAERFAELKPYVTVNGEKQYTYEDTRPLAYSILGETVAGKLGFTAIIEPTGETDRFTVTFGYEDNGTDRPVEHFTCAQTSMLQPNRNQYAACGDWLLQLRDNEIVAKRNTAARHFGYEARYLATLMTKPWIRKRWDAVKLRLMYYKHRMNRDKRQIWLINDRIGKADDNGEALFRYLLENRKDTVRPIYVIDGKCPDFERISKLGETVDPYSPDYKPLSLYADVSAGSHILAELLNPYSGSNGYILDLVNRRVIAFIRHGISKDDMSDSHNRHNGKFSMITAASRGEAASLTLPSYGLCENQVYLIGLARFDLLYNNPKKKIVIMPTWRKYLVSHGMENRSKRVVIGDLENSPYFLNYNRLLNDKRLFDTAERLGYQLTFVQHPAMRAAAIRPFDADPRLEMLEQADCYRDMFAEADLMVTDFSSVAFDFAYLYKPLIYFQPDIKEFFDHHYMPGYFEYRRDGLGDVIEDAGELIDELIAYMENGCQLKEKYRKRIDEFYPYRDQKNRERLADTIYGFVQRSAGSVSGKDEKK